MLLTAQGVRDAMSVAITFETTPEQEAVPSQLQIVDECIEARRKQGLYQSSVGLKHPPGLCTTQIGRLILTSLRHRGFVAKLVRPGLWSYKYDLAIDVSWYPPSLVARILLDFTDRLQQSKTKKRPPYKQL